MGLSACNSSGHLSNHADIAPNHAGITFAISNTLVSPFYEIGTAGILDGYKSIICDERNTATVNGKRILNRKIISCEKPSSQNETQVA